MLTQAAVRPRALTRILDAITPWWVVQLKPDVQEASWRDDDGTDIYFRTVYFEVEWMGLYLSAWPGVREGAWADRLFRALAAKPQPDTPASRFTMHCATGCWILGLALIAFSVLA